MKRIIPSVTATFVRIVLLLSVIALPARALPAVISASYDCSAQTDLSEAECSTLVVLYDNTNGPEWATSTGWLANSTPCAWYGVQCGEGSVIRLDLASNQLIGSIPPELIALTRLQTLNLASNQLSGSIPPELGSLGDMQVLDLSGNQLTGSIPSQLGNLSGLQILYLESNQLSGSIPKEVGNLSQLQFLYLDSNQLSGNIPAELGKLSGLSILLVNSNQLNGDIPVELASLAQLEILNLSGNQLSGSIAPELGSLDRLRSLDLSANPDLQGALPMSLTNLALGYFNFENTGLCEPADTDFQAWLAKIPDLYRTDVVCPVEMLWPLWLPVILR